MAAATEFGQWSLFTPACRQCDGAAEVGDLCCRCYGQKYRSQRFFAGNREAVLRRDERRCRVCGAMQQIVVHHRRPGIQDPLWLITLCVACHAQIHHSHMLRSWVPDELLQLWLELHPGMPVQMRIDITPAACESRTLAA